METVIMVTVVIVTIVVVTIVMVVELLTALSGVMKIVVMVSVL